MRGTTGNSYLARGKTRGSADMYLEHFGLRHPPLGKNLTEPWDDGPLVKLAERFNWLLHSPGIGLLTGEPGVGKTAALRSLTHSLNPHRYQVLYQAETDFGRVDIYRGLARALGVEPHYRRAQLWRDIKQRVHEMVDSKQLTPIWIIDEAQNLPAQFFRDFPSFLNFAFDSRDLMTVWLVGHPVLARDLERAPTPHCTAVSRCMYSSNPCSSASASRCSLPTPSRALAASTTCWPTPGWRSCAKPLKGYPARPGASCAPPCDWPCPRA